MEVRIPYRSTPLLALPLLFFCMGALIAIIATWLASLAAPEPVTLLDAAEAQDEDAIFRLISTGKDPGRSVVLERPLGPWKRGDTTSPLLVAVAGGEVNQVAYMMRHTRFLSDPPNDQALCIAARLDHANLTRFLMKMGVPAVPKNGCAEAKKPEDVAEKFGSVGLSKELRQYRLDAQ